MSGDRRRMTAREEVAASDRRWLLVAILVFFVSCAALAGVIAVYRWTGPHPDVILFLRAVRRLLRRLA